MSAPLEVRVLQRYLEAKTREVPVYNKDLDRAVWVLPETQKKDPGTYERINPKDLERPGERGKPKKPRKPAKPHPSRLHKDPIPAPIKPPRVEPKPKPPKSVKPVKPVPAPKVPEAPEKRRWTIKPEKPRSLEARDLAWKA